MVNIFPIQFLALFAYFLLRLFIAGVLLYLGIQHLRYRDQLQRVLRFPFFPFGRTAVSLFAFSELTIALFILVGAYTQLAALALMAMSIKMIFVQKYTTAPTIPSRIFYVLLLGTGITLFITGAGAFAFDLPI